MKKIFSARFTGKYYMGSMDILSVYTPFHSSSLVSSSAPRLSGSMAKIEPTILRFDKLIAEVIV